MSKRLKRVIAEAKALGLAIDPIRLDVPTNTAQAAADALGCEVAQIIKSILFRIGDTREHVLFLTAGDNRVDPVKAADVARAGLTRADAASIRDWTGFAIGGVSPIGHLNPVRKFFDPDILRFEIIWAAAGTPHHVFSAQPKVLREAIAAELAEFTD